MPFNPNEVRAQMARRGVKVEQLAALSGLHSQGIYKALSPNGNPTVSTLEKIAKGLGLPDESVFFTPHQHCSVNHAS